MKAQEGIKALQKSDQSSDQEALEDHPPAKDFLHKTASCYVESYGTIVIEGLNVAGTIKNCDSPRAPRMRADLISWIYLSKRLRALVLESPRFQCASPRSNVTNAPSWHPSHSRLGRIRVSTADIQKHKDMNAAKNILRDWTGPSEPNVTGC